MIPDTVVHELRAGLPGRAHLQLVLDAPWIEHRELTSDEEVEEFARFASLLVAKGRKSARPGCSPTQPANGGIAVLDDGPARKIARTNDVAHTGTLGLLCTALRENLLTVELVSTVADHLLEGEYRLPFRPGGFAKWAHDQGLVPPVGH